MSEFDIFVSSTGIFNISTLDHMRMIKNSAFVGNTGHFDKEIDLVGSEGLESMKVGNIKSSPLVTVRSPTALACGSSWQQASHGCHHPWSVPEVKIVPSCTRCGAHRPHSGTQCKSEFPYVCCDFGVPCDCGQGSTASGHFEEASYAAAPLYCKSTHVARVLL